ncbi:hypothetical protein DLJ53_33390 [Acuticoccus sediminis]|uniref:Addiction module killer protein n=1 Tax=Acuticoccus sediminis TaxID=2184697 RepID=A0A8B2NCL5_9HYPH|nr:type II toxin-antitoxin system RelE/ParE family toxin [Acuticoccus sediminis]RAH96119.1 hypothetical protein DLJ53_33390 [Acuticoccus sediminis]
MSIVPLPEFDKWLRRFREVRARAVIARRIGRMKAGNFGEVKPVSGGVSELRIDFGPGYRVYFTQRGRTIVVLLLGGGKDSQQADIAKAKTLASTIGDVGDDEED